QGAQPERARIGPEWEFLVVPELGRQGPSRMRSAAGMLVRWSPPLLLRSRRLQEEDDAAIGPFSRQKSLPWCRGDFDQHHAARSNAAPGPRACEAVWCGPGDHRAMAGLL